METKTDLKKIATFLDKYGMEGTWSGGNDSGGIDYIDTMYELEEGDENLIGEIEDLVYSRVLDPVYGGWAWNFSASGVIRYNREEKTIIVSGDHYDYDEPEVVRTVNIPIGGCFEPKDLKRIDSVNLYITDSETSVVRINILNGAWTQSLSDTEEKIIALIEEKMNVDEGDNYWFDAAIVNITSETSVDVQVTVPGHDGKCWEISLLENEEE